MPSTDVGQLPGPSYRQPSTVSRAPLELGAPWGPNRLSAIGGSRAKLQLQAEQAQARRKSRPSLTQKFPASQINHQEQHLETPQLARPRKPPRRRVRTPEEVSPPPRPPSRIFSTTAWCLRGAPSRRIAL
ncbi:uncharacterized protein JN550_002349 [Neoarthrinium moseri]|uniref:uncharacterized protein n=1 Tax=Neoarthrinium moseri TaxID=1658444 RepID=UPI001FDD2EA6|nr:uncharacterized protein JN550_002349 [Neoarthrinium moseri]KAI1874920.1 hypothetical protein JN550_002349 [Neoarthrinium moseri]